MKASIELSMYPLHADYGTPILKFIERLRQHQGLTVQTNNMSTQIFGEYDLLMTVLASEMKRSFAEEKTAVMVMKVVNLDLS